MRSTVVDAPWIERVTGEEWEIYDSVLREARSSGLPFALGGAFAVAAYTRHLRNTKDLDIYIMPGDREAMAEIMTRCGLEDYYSQAPYDRGWIYRGWLAGIIVDAIWAMPNQRAFVDELWLTRGPAIKLRGDRLQVLPAEELIWGKLYVMQRERCDWPDVLNLIYHAGPGLDWEHLLRRLNDDSRILAATLTIFDWLCPERADDLPVWVWERLQVRRADGRGCGSRSHLLDTRPWFGADFPRWPDK